MSRAPLSKSTRSVFGSPLQRPAACELPSSRYPAGNLGRHSPQKSLPVTPLGPGIGSAHQRNPGGKKEQKGSLRQICTLGSHLAEHCCCSASSLSGPEKPQKPTRPKQPQQLETPISLSPRQLWRGWAGAARVTRRFLLVAADLSAFLHPIGRQRLLVQPIG